MQQIDVPLSAMEFAIEAHGEQRYGDQPYRTHLAAVAQVLEDFAYSGPYLDAAWLHDTIEDTGVTHAALARRFGSWTADVVLACTGVGPDRTARNAAIYAKVGALPEAAVVKLADRIANVEAASPNSDHARRYWREAEAFHAAVASLAPQAMQDRLKRAYAASMPSD